MILTIQPDSKPNRVKIRFGVHRLKHVDCWDLSAIFEAANTLGVSCDGLRDAIKLYHTEGRTNFDVIQYRECPVETAWGNLEAAYPGVNREYLGSLVAATHDRRSETPIFVVSGVSGAGKSGTVHMAGRLVGGRVHEGIWDGMPSRGLRELEEAQRVAASFCLFDEFTKFARNRPTAILDAALLLTSTRFPHRPPIVFTDVQVPEGLFKIKQLTRRARFIRLPKRVIWPAPSDVLSIAPTAVNLVPEFLRHPWKKEESSDADIVRLCQAIQEAPEIQGAVRHKIIGDGWKRVEGELAKAWELVSDYQFGGSRYSSLRLAESDVAVVEYRRDPAGSDLFIRVRKWPKDL